MRLEFHNVEVRSRDMPWTVDDVGGEIRWQGDRLSAKIASSRVIDPRNPASIVPVSVTGNATAQGSQIDFALHAAAEARGAKGRISLDATGRHDTASGSGQAAITVAPVVFRAGGLQPRDFLPASGRTPAEVAGSAAVSGSVAWRGATVSPALVLRLADVAYEAKGALLSKVHGNIRITGLWPPATAPGQVLNGTVTAGGMPPVDATLNFQILPTTALRVEALRMDVAGGRISASPFRIDLVRPDIQTELTFRQIDLAQVFDLLGMEGLRGTGRLDGHIPLTMAGGRVLVRDGRLAASGPGVLQIRSDVLPKQVTDAGESMTLVLRALEDFHYDSLVIDLAGSPTGEGAITLRLGGHNPAVLDGRAFNLNIRLESNFDRLVDLALRAITAAQELLRRTAGNMPK